MRLDQRLQEAPRARHVLGPRHYDLASLTANNTLTISVKHLFALLAPLLYENDNAACKVTMSFVAGICDFTAVLLTYLPTFSKAGDEFTEISRVNPRSRPSPVRT
jgi:hypothetical protein